MVWNILSEDVNRTGAGPRVPGVARAVGGTPGHPGLGDWGGGEDHSF